MSEREASTFKLLRHGCRGLLRKAALKATGPMLIASSQASSTDWYKSPSMCTKASLGSLQRNIRVQKPRKTQSVGGLLEVSGQLSRGERRRPQIFDSLPTFCASLRLCFGHPSRATCTVLSKPKLASSSWKAALLSVSVPSGGPKSPSTK